MKRPITFRLKELYSDLAPLVERHCGIRDFEGCTYFGRGVRGDDEVEYILADEKLYALWFEDMDVMLGHVMKDELTDADVSISLVEEGDEKHEILADLAEQIRVADHTPGYTRYTPPGREPEVTPQRYWMNKPQPALDLRGTHGKITEEGNQVTIEVSADEDQN